jgi:predicted PurR-regulated permease PerM
MKANNTYRNQGIIVAIFCLFTLFLVFRFIDIITPFILGFMFAYILEPIIRYITEKKKFNKTFAIFIILTTFFTIFFVILYHLIPGLINQASELVTKLNVKKYFTQSIGTDKIVELLNDKFPALADAVQNGMDNISTFFFKFSNQIFANIVQSGKIILNLATILLITPILTFYFAMDMQKILDTLKNLIPISHRNDVVGLFKEINSTIAKYLRGQVTVSIILATYYSIGLFILQVDYALVLGIFSGLSLFIPYFGIMFSFILTSIIAFVHFKTSSIIIYLATFYIMGHVIEGVFITPRLMGKNLNLHPLWIFLGLFVGGSLLGFLGILFAIPLTAIIAVIIRFFIKVYKKSKLYKY